MKNIIIIAAAALLTACGDGGAPSDETVNQPGPVVNDASPGGSLAVSTRAAGCSLPAGRYIVTDKYGDLLTVHAADGAPTVYTDVPARCVLYITQPI